MAMFVILSPFALLSGLLSIAPPAVALAAASALSLAIVAVDLWRGKSLKLLQAATVAVTSLLSLYAMLDEDFTGNAARLSLDVGLLAVMLASLALRRPFTLQYARENVDAQIAARPEFLRANYVMTWVWTAATTVMLVADIGAHYVPWLPIWTGLAAAFAARNAAAWFTQWYGARGRARGEAARAASQARIIGDAA